jgi:hypothetical protein
MNTGFFYIPRYISPVYLTEPTETVVTGDPIAILRKDAEDAPHPYGGPDTLNL